MADYVVHPAFNYGGARLPGFWVGKYETSSKEGNGNSTSIDNVTTKTVQIKAGVSSWRYISISNMFTVCTELNNSGNPYGLNASDSVVDPHLMKNSEWGAVAYLSQNSRYGKGTEVKGSGNTSFITAGGNYKTNTNLSTTGNVYGIYDMSGGAWDYLAAYVDNGHENLTLYGLNLINADKKYKDIKDIYQASSTSGNDDQSTNYSYSTPTNGKYGDAIYETSNSYQDSNSWYSDTSSYPYSTNPFFFRGGSYPADSRVGLFYFSKDSGNASASHTFRVVIPVI